MLLTLPLAAFGAERIRVEMFLATECPISNRYVPELNRIAREYAGKGIDFVALFPEPGLDTARLVKWTKDYAAVFAAKLDPGGKQAREAGATLTPEVAVFVGRRPVYRGRIDDRYVSWGKSKAAPDKRDLVETLDQLLAHKIPAFHVTKSWGCFIEAGLKP